jgi:SAM-dependent methyltransferase
VYWASDINQHYLDRLDRLRQSRPYLSVQLTDASVEESYPAEEFDTVICLNVIEHLKDDEGALRNMRIRIKRSGRAIILVPNAPGLYGSLDRVLGHYRRYTREQLLATCLRAGFNVEKVLNFNRIGSPAWWWNGRVLKRSTFSLWQLKVLNTLLPLVRPIDKFLPFAPLSWIVILRNDGQTLELGSSGFEHTAAVADSA